MIDGNFYTTWGFVMFSVFSCIVLIYYLSVYTTFIIWLKVMGQLQSIATNFHHDQWHLTSWDKFFSSYPQERWQINRVRNGYKILSFPINLHSEWFCYFLQYKNCSVLLFVTVQELQCSVIFYSTRIAMFCYLLHYKNCNVLFPVATLFK
jgi:hypothetical protein